MTNFYQPVGPIKHAPYYFRIARNVVGYTPTPSEVVNWHFEPNMHGTYAWPAGEAVTSKTEIWRHVPKMRRSVPGFYREARKTTWWARWNGPRGLV